MYQAMIYFKCSLNFTMRYIVDNTHTHACTPILTNDVIYVMMFENAEFQGSVIVSTSTLHARIQDS